MTATAPVFTLDASVSPLLVNLSGVIGGDNAPFPVTVFGLRSGDAVQQMVATFKVAATDADNAATTVQVVITPTSDGGVTGIVAVPLSPTARQGLFPITSAQSALLPACTVYDVRVWVQRNGIVYDRIVQRGAIAAVQPVTGATAANPGLSIAWAATPPSALATNSPAKSFAATVTPANSGYAVTYSSSNTAAAAVDPNTGMVTAVGVGTTNITATVGPTGFQKTVTTSLTVYAALVPTLAWEPVQGQAYPRVFVADSNPTGGNIWSGPIFAASGYWGNRNSRTVPYSPDRWVTGLPQGNTFGGAPPGNNGSTALASIAQTTNPVPGYSSTPATMTTLVTFSAAPGAVWWPINRYWSAGDGDAFAPVRMWAQGLLVRAYNAADIGKTIDLIDSPTGDLSSTSVVTRKTFTLTANWQLAYVDGRFQGEDLTNQHWALGTGSTGTPALEVEIVWLLNMGPGEDDALNPAQGGWLTQWGLPAEMSNDNAWGPDSDRPPLYGATIAQVSTTDFAPDAADWFDHSPFTDYWMPNGAGVQAPGLVNLCDLNSDTGGVGKPTVGATALYAGVYVKPNGGGHLPNDGDLQATLICGAVTFGPINLVRDPAQLRRSTDGASFYRCRIQIQIQPPSQPIVTPSSTGGTLAAGAYYYKVTAIDAAGKESLPSAESTVTTTGATSSNALTWLPSLGAVSYRIYRGTTSGNENGYYTSSTPSFTDTGAATTAGTPPAAAPPVYTSGTLRILNATSGVLNVTATRWYAVPEAGRTIGWHNCLVPSRNVRVQAPSAAPTLTPSGTGGTLAAGTYRYVVTAIDNANNPMAESLPSAEASVTVSGTTSSVALSWPAVTGAAKYRVYRSPAGGAAGSENVYYTTSNSTPSFTDTGGANTAGSPPTTAPYMLQELAWMRANNVYDLVTVDHGMWGLRVMLPYDWQKVFTENRYQVGFWQSGPLGSSDYNFDMSFLNSGQAFPTLDVQMLRNGQVGFDGWECTIPCGDGAAQTIPGFQAVDIVLAWYNRTLLCIGIGFDRTSNITWLSSSSTLFGKPCSIGTRTPGSTWEFSNDGNMIIAVSGDRDRTRVHGGWKQDLLASKTVPATAAECQAILQAHVDRYWGARPGY